jgi:uncharacterized protein YjbJ (UPF0337 family)
MSILAAPNFYNQADQNIYNQGYSFIPQERFRGGAFNFPTTTDDDSTGITTLPITKNMSGNSGSSNYTGSVNDLMKNYTLDTRKQYFGSQPTPLVDDLYQSKLDKSFMGFPSYREQQLTGPDMGEYIGSDTDIPLELTRAGKIQDTLGNIKDTASGIMSNVKNFGPISMMLGSMDKFNTLSPADQEFIKQNMGYRGPTVFGENTSGLNKDIFGINTRSAFGNYADYVGKQADKLGTSLTKSAAKRGLTFDPVKGGLVDAAGNVIDEDDYNADMLDFIDKTKMMRNMFGVYTQKEKERVANEKAMAEKAAAAAAAAAAASRAESARQYDPNIHGGTNYGLGSDGQQSYSGDAVGASGLGFGVNATSGGPVSNRTGRGRTDYMNGGLANLVDIYD